MASDGVQAKALDKLYEDHLKRVSRSFAFCIEQLEQPLRRWVSLSYILCRLADSVEDSLWADTNEQLSAFDQFQKFIEKQPSITDVEHWRSTFPASIPDGEKLLLKDSSEFFAALHALPDQVRHEVQKTVVNMVRGMKFHNHRKHNIRTLPEANQYCFFVAGIVGELLTDLVCLSRPGFTPTERIYDDAFHFGLYLQKINLLKDQRGDELEGRRLVPSREEMKQSLVVNAEHALNYILSIPVEFKGYRVFCAWSFFLGIISLPYIEKSWSEKSHAKVSRSETAMFLGRVYFVINDNDALRKLYENHLPLFKDLNANGMTLTELESEPSWFSEIYHGRLSTGAMAELGMFRGGEAAHERSS